MRIASVVLILCLYVTACKCQVGASDSGGYTGNFVVSFEGQVGNINYEAKDKLKICIAEFNGYNLPPIAYRIWVRGLEGEEDFCFRPNGSPNFDQFITKVKRILKNEKLVTILEHKECRK